MADQNKSQGDGEAKPGDEFTGFNIKINEFGEIVCSHNIDDINQYLDVNVVDKKLKTDKNQSSE